MAKFLFVFFLIANSITFPQSIDSLLIPVPGDTIRTEDSTLVRDTTISQDTTGLLDSAKTAAAVDTLLPIKQKVIYGGSSFISQEVIKALYSSYEGNTLIESERVFIRDYSFIGYPDELFYYGTNGVNILDDGLSLNNLYGYTNTSHIMSESVDSIELIPAVRGFLYGQTFNHTSINFITKDFLSQAPYTRIKYYEGPFGEGMLNGIFNSIFFNRMNVYADVTNRSSDVRYFNTDLSSWQGKIKAKYFISDEYNLIASYNYNHQLSGLNGGVNADSISSFTNNLNEYIYDEILAPVVFRTRQLEDKQHLFRGRLLANPYRYLYTDLNLYYSFSLFRIYANDDEASDFAYKSKSFGAYLDQRYEYGPFSLALRGNFENTEILVNTYLDEVPVNKINTNIYSAAAVGSVAILDSLITPALFIRTGKTLIGDNSNQLGGGADVIICPLKYLSLYTGYSFSENPHSSLSGLTFESGISMHLDFLKVKGEYYSRKDFFRTSAFPGGGSISGLPTNDPVVLNHYLIQGINHNGINGNVELKIWSFLLSSSVNYPFFSGGEIVTGLPRLTSRSGFFFKDNLFSGNLDLKAGFLFYYWGEQFLTESRIKGNDFSPDYVPEAYRLDFTITGEIQKTAILFFTWENITDYKYYITPFYPMPFSGIKFGVSWELFN